MNDFGIGGVHKGHEEVATFFGRLPIVFGELRVEPQEFVEQGDHVVVLGTHHVRTPSGVAADYRFAHAWTMSDGLATRFEEFVDTAVIHRLLSNGLADN
nr:nuclear transport factor 2 family protein [Micromonospora sp. DSM 115978]